MDHGHDVVLYTHDNNQIRNMSYVDLFITTIWSRRTVKEINNIITNEKPDIIHAHNVFPLISPSLYWVAAKHGIPLVQTIHNFRLACLQAVFLRKNRVCEDCISKVPWRGVLHRCYKDSISASTVLALSLQFHRLIGTYGEKVTSYIALNSFCKSKLIEMGLPAHKIHVKPNFVTLDSEAHQKKRGNPLFVGRLSDEKGISILEKSIQLLPGTMFDIVGDGPERHILDKLPNVRLLGLLDQDEVYNLMIKSPFLILPSLCYESMPRTLVESFGCGTPVIASRLGALSELVEHGRTGLLFDAGSSDDLVHAISWALGNVNEMEKMGENAKNIYKSHYTEDANYKLLMDIYRESVKR